MVDAALAAGVNSDFWLVVTIAGGTSVVVCVVVCVVDVVRSSSSLAIAVLVAEIVVVVGLNVGIAVLVSSVVSTAIGVAAVVDSAGPVTPVRRVAVAAACERRWNDWTGEPGAVGRRW